MILFLDFDGVLHPDEVYVSKGGVVLRCDGHNLFEHAELLAGLLEPFHHVKIVLSTSWVPVFGFEIAKARLPERLQAKIIGTTFNAEFEDEELWKMYSRHFQIGTYVERHGLTEWCAIDDDDAKWPDEKRYRLVHTSGWGGIGDKDAQAELIAKLQRHGT